MSFYRVVPIAPSTVERVRGELKSPQYGHPAHVEPARGYGPCRSCLETFRVGEEERILFTYNPFDGFATYPSPGPVFIHRAPCAPFAGAGVPAGLRALPLVVEGFGDGRRLLHQEFVGDQDVHELIAGMLADERVAYAHLRNAEAGCFIARIDRVA
jgi:hypothetical protein